MNVIFLDVDGVLNNQRHILALYELLGEKNFRRFRKFYGQTILDYKCCELVKKLAQKKDAKIVLSSTWRLSDKYTKIVEDELDMEIYGITPYLDKERGYEIKQYLKEHNEFNNYVIVDDDSDMLEEQMSHLCLVNREVGFTRRDYRKCVEILKDGKNNDID